ncbi:hypothetical protein C0971_15420 [Bacillus methanolicus]|uniref:hypothetical protein n=1 Tax=Bacillaceae TaxID=186817 RepID=UPI0003619458|nr:MULTISPECIES: hypothetical protein [Bacillaceae]RGR83026.1 hypothetical protein DWY22_10730 [Heyndrickxia coagulans]RGR98049.1 hypothetical protein DWY16_09030 [Heyndrickxia coagulans]UQD53264.1 hypothetical protein C0971_15420 [Bacillus methanolicus]
MLLPKNQQDTLLLVFCARGWIISDNIEFFGENYKISGLSLLGGKNRVGYFHDFIIGLNFCFILRIYDLV